MGDLLFLIAVLALGLLFGANVTVMIARIYKNDVLARRILDLSSRVTWIFKLGEEGKARRENGRNGHLRA